MTHSNTRLGIEVAATTFGLNESTLYCKGRTDEVANAKRLACELLVNRLGHTAAGAARALRYADHTTVLHHLKTSENLMDVDPEWERAVEDAAAKLDLILSGNHPTHAKA